MAQIGGGMYTHEHTLEAILRREAEAANLDVEAENLDESGNPGRAAFVREQARILRAANRVRVPETA